MLDFLLLSIFLVFPPTNELISLHFRKRLKLFKFEDGAFWNFSHDFVSISSFLFTLYSFILFNKPILNVDSHSNGLAIYRLAKLTHTHTRLESMNSEYLTGV